MIEIIAFFSLFNIFGGMHFQKNIIRIITVVFSVIFAAMFLSDLANADYKAKCAVCHGEDGKKITKVDPVKMAIDTCVQTVTNGKGTMKPVKLDAPDTAQAICEDYIKTLLKK